MEGVQLIQAMGLQQAPNVVHTILSGTDEFKGITLSDGTTKLLDLLLAMNNCDEFSNFLQKLADVNATVPRDSPVWPGCSALHLAIMMTKETKLWEELLSKLDPQHQLYSFLQAQSLTREDNENYQRRIDICLKSGCSVKTKNAEDLTPIHLAFKLHQVETVNLLLDNCDVISVEPGHPSFLHIASAIGKIGVVERLLSAGADVDSLTSTSFDLPHPLSHKTKLIVPGRSTALHVAAIFQCEEIVEMLLDSGANVYAENSLGLTPIHSCMVVYPEDVRIRPKSIARLLLKRAPNLRGSVSESGLSHLHVAAYADDAVAIKKLLRKKTNIDSVFKITSPELSHLALYANRTPLHVAIRMRSRNAILALMRSRADIFQRTPEVTTPLQHVIGDYVQDSPIRGYVKRKLQNRRRVDEAVDANGTTLLHVACRLFDHAWAKKILSRGADVNARVLDYKEEEGGWKSYTPMHLLVEAISERRANEEAGQYEAFAKLLIDNGADLLAIGEGEVSSLLLAHTLACQCGWDGDYEVKERLAPVMFPIADLLLKSQKTFSANPANRQGFSHFHYACTRNLVDVVEKFLDNGVDVNHTANCRFGDDQEASSFSPLHFALYHRSVEVARLLIERGADCNAQANDYEETPFHIAIIRGLVDLDLYEMLLSHGADIEASAFFRRTPVYCFFKKCRAITLDHVTFFMKHGATIELNNEVCHGVIGLAIKNAKPSDREAIFEVLFGLVVKNSVKGDFNPIENIADVWNKGEITVDFYLNAIQRFIDLSFKLDQQNEQGKTALHRATDYINVEAIKALFLFGADVNIRDKNDKTPISSISSLRYPHYDRIKKILAAHVWKMKFVGLKVHEMCEAAMLEIHQKLPLDENFKRECEEELDVLSRKNIGEFLTMKGFLREWSPAMDYPRMSFVQKYNIEQFFINSAYIRENYPQFCGLLMMQYRKAVARVNMYEIALELLPSALLVDLPALCLDNILKFFNNDELQYFIEGHQVLSADDV